jgi:hypothetical protein
MTFKARTAELGKNLTSWRRKLYCQTYRVFILVRPSTGSTIQNVGVPRDHYDIIEQPRDIYMSFSFAERINLIFRCCRITKSRRRHGEDEACNV